MSDVVSAFGPNFQFAAVQRYGRYRGTPDGRGTRAAPPHLTRRRPSRSPIIAMRGVPPILSLRAQFEQVTGRRDGC
jgi:hypothetical protein